MKISFMTFACPEWTAEEVIAGAVRHGYSGIEWRIESNHAHGVEVTMPPDERAVLRRHLANVGVASACLATSLRFVQPEAVMDAPARIDLAADIGASGLRVFCGPLPEGMTLEDAIPRAADHLHHAADYAQQCGVSLWLETHDAVNRGAPVAAILEQAAHPALAATWDNMHPAFNGEAFEDTKALLHGRIAHTHFHDALSGDPATIVPFGAGNLPCAAMLAYLRDEGFVGYLSGEWFNSRMGDTPDAALETYISGLRSLLSALPEAADA